MIDIAIPPLSFLNLPKTNTEQVGMIVFYWTYITTEIHSFYTLSECSIAQCNKKLSFIEGLPGTGYHTALFSIMQ